MLVVATCTHQCTYRWSGGQAISFRERGPGSIPGATQVEEIVRFQNVFVMCSSVWLEPETVRSEAWRSTNCARAHSVAARKIRLAALKT